MQNLLMQISAEQWPVLSKLLDEVLELPVDARETWFESLPQEHAVLKPTLRELLVNHAAAETNDFLHTMPKFSAANSEAEAAGSKLAPGTAVGAYVLEQEIGRGGMGAVWRARRSDGVINRPVALKLPHAGLYGDDLIERFAREREILASLAHPNIARLYDAGFAAGGQPYLALEYVPGMPLTRYCDDQRLSVSARLRLFQQVLKAVQYAHAHLVIHRDIKPSNVIVGPDGQAMLLDFGIAKLTAVDASPEAAAHTQFAAALTPDYASPEQISGQPVSTASDIYSLGVLLYELLVGQGPYRLRRSTRGELEEAILNVEATRPSQSLGGEGTASARSGTTKSLSRILRGDLDTIVLKALKKAPAERYATADAFSQDIERYLRGEPVAARPDSRWYRTRKFVARNKLPVIAGSLAIAVVIATAAVAFYEAHTAAAERDRALALSSRNEAVTVFLSTLITEVAGDEKPVTVSDMLARSESLVSQEYSDSPENRAAVLSMLGIYYHTVGADARAEPLLRQALDAVRTSSDGDLRRKIECDHALMAGALGKADEARRTLNAVISDPHATALQSAECLQYLSYMAQDENDGASAVKFATLALQRLHEVPHVSPATEANFLGSLGFSETLNGRNAAAEKDFRKSLDEFTRIGRERSADAVSVRNNWAIMSDMAGEPRRALELYEQTLQIFAQKHPGVTPPPYLTGNRGRSLEALGRFDEASAAYSACVSATQDAGKASQRAFCLLGLASASRELGKLSEAEDQLGQVAAIVSPLPAGHPAVVSLHLARARVALAAGRIEDARREVAAVPADAKSAQMLASTLLTQAELHLADRHFAEAEAAARKALPLIQASQGGVPYSNRTGLAWLTLGRVLVETGDSAQARDAFQNSVLHLSNTVDSDYPKLVKARELAGK